MALQFTAAPGHGDDAKPVASSRTRLTGAGLQHSKPTAENAAGRHRRCADHDRFAPSGKQYRD